MNEFKQTLGPYMIIILSDTYRS